MRRLLLAVLATILAWVGGAGSGEAVIATSGPLLGNAYDAPIYDAPGNDAASERGPPAQGPTDTIYDTVDGWSRGTLVRPERLTPPSPTTYAYPVAPAQVARATTTTGPQVVVDDGDLASSQRLHVAANTGSDLAQGFNSFRAAKRSLPSPGQGNVYDHVVEQSQIAASRSGFDPRLIHNPYNLNPVSAAVNQAKANYYSSIRTFTGGQTVRNWLNGQSFEQQYSFGMEITGLIQRGVTLP